MQLRKPKDLPNTPSIGSIIIHSELYCFLIAQFLSNRYYLSLGHLLQINTRLALSTNNQGYARNES